MTDGFDASPNTGEASKPSVILDVRCRYAGRRRHSMTSCLQVRCICGAQPKRTLVLRFQRRACAVSVPHRGLKFHFCETNPIVARLPPRPSTDRQGRESPAEMELCRLPSIEAKLVS